MRDGRARCACPRCLNERPVRAVGQQFLENHGVQAVAAPIRTVGSEKRSACERQIADGIEHFVTDKLLLVAQTFAVHDLVFADGDSVGEIGAECQASFPELFDVAHEAECAGAGQFVAEYAWAHFISQPLTTDQGRREINFYVEAEASVEKTEEEAAE